jgi:endonuclease YncB( thermonuclease family)
MCLSKLLICFATEKSAIQFSFKNTKKYGKVLRVIDGDTILVAIRFQNTIFKISVRFSGINSFETNSKDEERKRKGVLAKEYLKKRIEGKLVWLEFESSDGCYGRSLAKVYRRGVCLNDEMIEKGHAQVYDGKGRVIR